MSTWHYICIVVSVGVITWTNVEVKNAYMDEEFHYNQTKEYCNNNFHKWHSKITTFPGLYIIGYLFTKFTSIIFFNQFCKLTVLRYINLIPLFFLYCYTKRILSKRTYFGNDHHIELAAISCITLPILYFYIVFYYTDIWSLLFVLMNYYYFHYESNFPMSLFSSIMAVLIRQDNIIWIFFCSFKLFLYHLRTIVGGRKRENILVILKNFLLSNVQAIITVLLLLYVVVIYNNGRITLGDHQHHQIVHHFSQFIYLTLLIPILFPFSFLSHLPQLLPTNFRRLILFIILPLISLFFFNFSYHVHPFILSDNRHYVFYVWSKFFLRFSSFIYYLSIIFPFAFIFAYVKSFDHFQYGSLFFSYFFCTIISIIFHELVEPRYFIIPIFFWNLFRIHSIHSIHLHLQLSLNLFWNVLLWYIYLMKPFGQNGKIQRFMP